MIRNFIFFTVLWLSMTFSLLLFIPYLFLLPFPRSRDRFVSYITGGWSLRIMRIGGIRLRVKGRENLPEQGNFVVVSNHQGTLDIPVLLASIPYKLSFISKKEVLAIPLFNMWFFALGCLAIDRNKAFSSRKKIRAFIHPGRRNPVLIFPEGTRSRSSQAGKFKTGALQYAYNSGLDIVPVKIDGSYLVYEEKGRITPGVIGVEIFPPLKNYREEVSFGDFVRALEEKLT